MAKTGQEVLRCAYPGCENQPRPAEAGRRRSRGTAGSRTPVTGQPHTAPTALLRRQALARYGGGMARAGGLGRLGFAVRAPACSGVTPVV